MITLPWGLRLGTDRVLQAGSLGEGDVIRDVTSNRHLAHLIQEETSSFHSNLQTSNHPHPHSLPPFPPFLVLRFHPVGKAEVPL